MFYIYFNYLNVWFFLKIIIIIYFFEDIDLFYIQLKLWNFYLLVIRLEDSNDKRMVIGLKQKTSPTKIWNIKKAWFTHKIKIL